MAMLYKLRVLGDEIITEKRWNSFEKVLCIGLHRASIVMIAYIVVLFLIMMYRVFGR
jgi:hypothetical protein